MPVTGTSKLKRLDKLTQVLTVMLWGAIGIGTLELLLCPWQLWQLSHLQGDLLKQTADQMGTAFFILTALTSFLWTVTYCLFYRWIYCIHYNLRVVGKRGLTFRPWQVVLVQICPIVNLYFPFRAMKEAWKATDPRFDHADEATAWKRQPDPSIVTVWWFFYLVFWFFAIFFNRQISPEEWSPEHLITILLINLVFMPFSILNSAVTLVLIKQLSAWQQNWIDSSTMLRSVLTTIPLRKSPPLPLDGIDQGNHPTQEADIAKIEHRDSGYN